jgi:hypothetical protein
VLKTTTDAHEGVAVCHHRLFHPLEKKMPGHLARAFDLHRLVVPASRPSTATAATATVVVVSSIGTSTTLMSDRCRNSFCTVEVRLVFLVDFLAFLFVEVLAALNQNGALI